jgi:ribonuclease D
VLREIWHWREQEALAANRPPFFVLSHETLINLAASATARGHIDDLLPRHFSSRRKDGLQEAIQRGLHLASQDHPHPLRFHSRRQTETERRSFLELESAAI